MAADLSAVPPPPASALQIDRATTPEQLRAFAEVNAANWVPPDPHVVRFYELATPLRLAADCPLWLYVGRVGGEAVAAAGLVVGGGVAGVYAVSTRAAHRRRGYGTAMMARLLADARAAGLPAAVLQASADGVGLYARVGFRPVGQFTEYKPRVG
ncbi:MAG: GNAT family N-acetyltransferase [Gemmataceae bacterium]